ncbi:MAG: CBS domain-containing protein [Oscillospiraceae bacterium]
MPVLDKDGGYCGVLTEGDPTLGGQASLRYGPSPDRGSLTSEITARREVHPVRVDTRIEDLVLVAADQNFVPVIDDKNASHRHIVTRSSILKYCLDRYFSREYELVGAR